MNLDDFLKPGTLTVFQHRHGDGCPTIRTQKIDDCTCDEVEAQLINATDMTDAQFMEALGLGGDDE